MLVKLERMAVTELRFMSEPERTFVFDDRYHQYLQTGKSQVDDETRAWVLEQALTCEKCSLHYKVRSSDLILDQDAITMLLSDARVAHAKKRTHTEYGVIVAKCPSCNRLNSHVFMEERFRYANYAIFVSILILIALFMVNAVLIG